MTDLIDFVKLLTALVSLLTALIGLSEALKQRTKQIRTTLKKGGLLLGYNPRAPGSRLKARARTSSRPSAS